MSLMDLDEFRNCRIQIYLRGSKTFWGGVLNAVNDEYVELLGPEGDNRVSSIDRILVKEIVAACILNIEDRIIKKFEQELEALQEEDGE